MDMTDVLIIASFLDLARSAPTKLAINLDRSDRNTFSIRNLVIFNNMTTIVTCNSLTSMAIINSMTTMVISITRNTSNK